MAEVVVEKLKQVEAALNVFLPNLLNEEKFRGKAWANINTEFTKFYGEQLSMRFNVKELLFNLDMIGRGTVVDVTLENTKEHTKELAANITKLRKQYITSMNKFSGRINQEVNSYLDNFKNGEIKSLLYDVEQLITNAISK